MTFLFQIVSVPKTPSLNNIEVSNIIGTNKSIFNNNAMLANDVLGAMTTFAAHGNGYATFNNGVLEIYKKKGGAETYSENIDMKNLKTFEVINFDGKITLDLPLVEVKNGKRVESNTTANYNLKNQFMIRFSIDGKNGEEVYYLIPDIRKGEKPLVNYVIAIGSSRTTCAMDGSMNDAMSHLISTYSRK